MENNFCIAHCTNQVIYYRCKRINIKCMRNKHLALVCCNSIYYNNHRQTENRRILLLLKSEKKILVNNIRKNHRSQPIHYYGRRSYIFLFFDIENLHGLRRH